ncbi:hypothetical protein JOQ06_008443 [Pogonophryne albipinna]|uniref:Phospholipase A2-like central domain-containing protein n=1 Tax=Pogonophryne albipinna TaxID=1090488 RepID=A0AAD6FA20_9TELE|nr:hypothetical protein JOQ06_008443 [Pogonophryne albipinna]
MIMIPMIISIMDIRSRYIDNPYTELYSSSCDNKKVSCGSDNNECEMFICECDRKAAECFGRTPWLPENA